MQPLPFSCSHRLGRRTAANAPLDTIKTPKGRRCVFNALLDIIAQAQARQFLWLVTLWEAFNSIVRRGQQVQVFVEAKERTTFFY